MGQKEVFFLFWKNIFFFYQYRVRNSAMNNSYLFLVNNKVLHTENIAVYIIKYELWK